MMHDSRMIQALHAAISRSNWSEVERAANALRDDEQSARKLLAGTDIGSLPHDMTTADMAKLRMATIASLTEQMAIVTAERDSIADANHRQVHCIHLTAQALGPDYSATVDGLPKAAKRVAEQLAEARKTIDNAAYLMRLITEWPTASHELTYTNYRGETSVRVLHLVRLWLGATHWHPEPQLLLQAFDNQKDAYRDFAVKDFDIPDARATLSRLEKQEGEA